MASLAFAAAARPDLWPDGVAVRPTRKSRNRAPDTRAESHQRETLGTPFLAIPIRHGVSF